MSTGASLWAFPVSSAVLIVTVHLWSHFLKNTEGKEEHEEKRFFFCLLRRHSTLPSFHIYAVLAVLGRRGHISGLHVM